MHTICYVLVVVLHVMCSAAQNHHDGGFQESRFTPCRNNFSLSDCELVNCNSQDTKQQLNVSYNCMKHCNKCVEEVPRGTILHPHPTNKDQMIVRCGIHDVFGDNIQMESLIIFMFVVPISSDKERNAVEECLHVYQLGFNTFKTCERTSRNITINLPQSDVSRTKPYGEAYLNLTINVRDYNQDVFRCEVAYKEFNSPYEIHWKRYEEPLLQLTSSTSTTSRPSTRAPTTTEFTCPDTQWKCSGSNQCIQSEKQCDGFKWDCIDQSDEDNCNGETTANGSASHNEAGCSLVFFAVAWMVVTQF